MISVLTRPRRIRRYLVYDLEWVPHTLQIRMCGVYDGNRYRWYTSIAQFVANELTSQNRGKWFYAHAGGLADFQFVLENLLDSNDYQISASFSGSSAIIVHVRRGKNSWHFVDSYWLLRDSLRNIGKNIGIQKGNLEQSEEWYATASIDELRDYNEIDCLILYRAIQWFEDVLLTLGGELKMTVASCAMDLFRRRFLRSDIATSMRVNDTIRDAYYASRVEVIERHCQDSYYYDVNSSFPYAMTFPVPGDLIGTYNRRMPDYGLYFADVEVTIPDNHLPCIPIRTGGRLFFPTGRVRGWYSHVDIDLLLQTGGRIERVYESMAFEPRTDLRDYAKTIYDLRTKSTGFETVVLKYVLNSLYGKFAESDIKKGMLINPETPQSMETMLLPGVFLVERRVPIPHMHVPISAFITAVARRTLYRFMGESSTVHYCDTDGFSTTDMYTDGTGLGALKLEKRVVEGEFIAAKVYDLLQALPDGVYGPLQHIVRAKGFSRMDYEKFCRLRNGDEIEYTRMKRIQELMRKGAMRPTEYLVKKRLRTDAIPKRFFYPDGHSRPWHVSELESIDG